MRYQLTIQRSRWANPSYDTADPDHGSSQLLNDRGCMCCLGFAMEKAGFEWQDIDEVSTPEEIFCGDEQEWPAKVMPHKDFVELFFKREELEDYSEEGPATYFRWRDTKLTADAIHINDHALYSLEEREAKLIELFAKHDIALVFVD